MNCIPFAAPFPVNCSWCDRPKVPRHTAPHILWCPNCDAPGGALPKRKDEERTYHGPGEA